MSFHLDGFGDCAAPLCHVRVAIARERLCAGRTQAAVFDCVLYYEDGQRETIYGCLITQNAGRFSVKFPPQELRLRNGRTIRFPACVPSDVYYRVRAEAARQIAWGNA